MLGARTKRRARVAVYVDEAIHPCGRMLMCHMLADSPEELHAMVDKIGVDREWFRGDHYDICKSKRLLALEEGAKKVSSRELVRVRRRWRAKYGNPR